MPWGGIPGEPYLINHGRRPAIRPVINWAGSAFSTLLQPRDFSFASIRTMCRGVNFRETPKSKDMSRRLGATHSTGAVE